MTCRFLTFFVPIQVLFLTLFSFSVFSRYSGPFVHKVDVALVGGGVMNANLGVLLKELNPDLEIETYERMPYLAGESSGVLDNAGTGHESFIELNYTPVLPNGQIDISKARKINEEFKVSKQFWAYLVTQGLLEGSDSFIHAMPHMSWVHGRENVDFLRSRFAAMKESPLFAEMEYSEDPAVLREWMPLVMEGRTSLEPMAATRVKTGTDIDFGKLTRLLFRYYEKKGGKVFTSHEVRDLRKNADGTWSLKVRDLKTGQNRHVRAKFVFIGAGGYTLPLLQRAGISAVKGYGGFPVGGEFLVTTNPEIVEKARGKIYGKAALDAPPMSVPHLDLRIIDGKPTVLFGPFASATLMFLKNGSMWDLLRSVRPDNIKVLLKAFFQEFSLVGYLVEQEMLTLEQQILVLQEFILGAKKEDWKLIPAGKRVQIIKEYPGKKSVLQLGTERISEGNMGGLVGASPGGSIAPSIVIDTTEHHFAEQMRSPSWQRKMREMIPSYRKSLEDDPLLLKEVQTYTNRILGLNCEWLAARP